MTDYVIQHRHNTAAGAADNNRVLAAGEPGWASDSRRWKTGDGSTPWNDLPWDDDKLAPKHSVTPTFTVDTYYGGTLGAGDDTTCIQNTIDACYEEQGGGIVVVPSRGTQGFYRAQQLVIPPYVHLKGMGWQSQGGGSNGAIAKLWQLGGVNDDFIVFTDTDEANTWPWAGPASITDLVLRGPASLGATAGHGINFRTDTGKICGFQDNITLERLFIRGFAGSGIYIAKGSPVVLQDIRSAWNGRYGVEIEDNGGGGNNGMIHEVLLHNISGDGNMGGLSDDGGATVYLKGLKGNAAAVYMSGIKSEFGYRSTGDGGDGTVMGNRNAIIIENCSCPIALAGVGHIASGATSQTRKPGNAVQIKGANRPNLTWSGIGIRNQIATQTVGADPYYVYDEVTSRGSNSPNGQVGPTAMDVQHATVQLFNTTDQATNWERVRTAWVSNVFKLISEAAGTGTKRDIVIDAGASLALSDGLAKAIITAGSSLAGSEMFTVTGTHSASSGLQRGIKLVEFVSQTGTAGYTALDILVTETTTGSGAKFLCLLRTGAGTRFSVDNAGNVIAAGNVSAVDVVTSGNLELGNASDTTVSRVSAGVIAVEGFTVTTKSVVPVTTTATLAAVAGREYVVLLGSGAVPTIPTAVSNTSMYHVKNTTAAAISLAATSSQTFDGMAGPLVIHPNDSYTLVSDNANWVII